MKQIMFNKKFWISIWPTNIFIATFLVIEMILSNSEYITVLLQGVFVLGILALCMTFYGIWKVKGWQKILVIVAGIGDVALLALIYIILSIEITF